MKNLISLSKVSKHFFSKAQLHLTPHQLWLTQGNGMERAFTGDLWNMNDVGTYHCVVCDTALFRYYDLFLDPIKSFLFHLAWHLSGIMNRMLSRSPAKTSPNVI